MRSRPTGRPQPGRLSIFLSLVSWSDKIRRALGSLLLCQPKVHIPHLCCLVSRGCPPPAKNKSDRICESVTPCLFSVQALLRPLLRAAASPASRSRRRRRLRATNVEQPPPATPPAAMAAPPPPGLLEINHSHVLWPDRVRAWSGRVRWLCASSVVECVC
jgi:hypothetical protein